MQADSLVYDPYKRNFEMTTLNLGHLATFRLVVQRGSFSAAADVLGLSQPAVSLQVRQLEQFLQTRLIERTGRGIKATAAGMALLAHGDNIERAVSAAVQSVSEFNREISGAITLGTGATACIHLLPPVLQQLRQAHPLRCPLSLPQLSRLASRRVAHPSMRLGLLRAPRGQPYRCLVARWGQEGWLLLRPWWLRPSLQPQPQPQRPPPPSRRRPDHGQS